MAKAGNSAGKGASEPWGPSRKDLARAALAAIEPVVELLLQLGITSPEAESLLRGLFVHKAHERLARQNDGASPSDVRVALVSGVHRNFVKQILAEPPTIAPSRASRAHPATRLLEAWYTDPSYQDDHGRPTEVPEKGASPSFSALVATYLPGVGPEVLLEEMLRAGAVESLSHHRVRVRSRTMRQPGLTLESVAQFGQQARGLLDALARKLAEPQDGALVEATPAATIGADRLGFVRNVLARRIEAFLAQITQELEAEAHRSSGGERRVAIRLHVVETEGSTSVSVRRRREST